MADLDQLNRAFEAHFGRVPEWYQAPGRVNLIGEFTDYNEGFVLPVAIPFYTRVAVRGRSDRRLRVRSTQFRETREMELPHPQAQVPARSSVHWSDYVLGVAWALEQQGVALRGADLLIHGEVPLGAGLSSSAALEVATALALSSLAGHSIEKRALAQLAQRAENEFVGLRCGIMDQLTSVLGEAGYALKIDCRSLECDRVPLAPANGPESAARIVICNTQVRHRLASSAYNQRREECEQGARQLKGWAPDIAALRDVSPEFLRAHEADLDPLIYRRCRHVVTENERVVDAAVALKAGDLEGFGRLMGESHQSLRTDFEVSCSELDLMVDLAQSMAGVYGARMTGGGFGGCTVNLVRADQVPTFRSMMAARYTAATGQPPEIYVCDAANGAGPVQPTSRTEGEP